MNAYVGPVLPVHDVQAKRCRTLWCAVLYAAFVDATAPGKKGDVGQAHARAFFGTKRFYKICALAGYDGDYIMRGYRSKMAELGEAA